VAATAGNSYRFAVRAEDNVGNFSAYSFGPTFTVRVYDSTSSSIGFTGSWGTWNQTGALGGSTRYTWNAGDKATLAFTGRNVTWLGTTSGNAGSATVNLDGGSTDVSQRSTTLSNQKVLFARKWDTSAAHTISVVANGCGTASCWTDVDAFVVYQ
jgi:hypothetical protein